MICENSYREGDLGSSGNRGSGEGAGGSGGRNATKAPASDQNTAIDSCDNSSGDSGSPASGHPVVLATGEKYKTERDIRATGIYGLELERTYRSFDTKAKLFGPKWRSSYDYFALTYSGCFYDPDYQGVCIPTAITAVFPDGATYTYTRAADYHLGFRVKNSKALGLLVYEGTLGWTLTRGRKVYAYSASGVLQSIKTEGGTLLQQFSYAVNSTRPSKVTNAAGQSIEFTYVNNKVTQVKDPAGNVWTYAYDHCCPVK